MHLIRIAACCALFLSPGLASADGDPVAGQAKSAICVACHGPQGISSNTQWPNLAGQQKQYLIKQLKAFREGDRQDPLMSAMAAGLSDEDIENLAAWYNSLD
jgi:cytochrome c553